MEKFTWYELKKFCNSLTGDQLGYEVKGWGDEKGCTIEGVETLEDDFINPSGEGAEPLSTYKNDPDFAEFIEDEAVVLDKNQPMLIMK